MTDGDEGAGALGRGERVFAASQVMLAGLLPPGEELRGTMLTMFRRRGFMKRCVIGATPTRLLVVPIKVDGSMKGEHLEIRRDDVVRWQADGIANDVGVHFGASLRITTKDGSIQINPPVDVGIPDGFDRRCVVEFLLATGLPPG